MDFEKVFAVRVWEWEDGIEYRPNLYGDYTEYAARAKYESIVANTNYPQVELISFMKNTRTGYTFDEELIEMKEA